MKQLLNELKEIKELLCLNQPVLSFHQFCLFADLSEDYCRKLQGQGKIPFYRPFGKKLYIAKEDAINVLLQNRIHTEDAINSQVNNHLLTSKTAV